MQINPTSAHNDTAAYLAALGYADAMTQRAGYTTIRIPARAKPALPDVRLALAPLLQSRTSISAAEDRQAGDA